VIAAPTLAGALSTVHRSGGISTAAVVVAVLAGMLAIACLAWALARAWGLEPRWTLSARHAIEEAGFRTRETFSELADWLRLGR
jgi:hypothetical protein